MEHFSIVVIGASAGGVTALKQLVSRFPADLPAAVSIVMHMSPYHPTQLHTILGAGGPLPVIRAADGLKLEAGRIYIARPNHHLLVKKDRLAVVFGPRENRARPSIDVLMRSAAVYHTTRVIGVLLTGYLTDGVSGISAVKRCGGVTLVQDPAQCQASDLPRAAIAQAEIDHVLPLDGLALKIDEIARRPGPRLLHAAVPEDIMEEVRVSEHEVPDLEHMHKIGDLTPYTCPECGGALWKAKKEPHPRYICHTGHSFSEASYLEGQAEMIENSLWSAMRFVQERIDVLQKMIPEQRAKGNGAFADDLARKVTEMQHHVGVIRKFIMSGALTGAQNNIEAAAK